MTGRIFCAVGSLAVAAALVGCARVAMPPGKPDVAEKQAPRIIKAEPADAYHVDVTFSEAMDVTTLRDKDNYKITDEGGELLPIEAIVTRDNGVTLITAGQTKGFKYKVAVRNVADAAAGNKIKSDNSRGFKGSRRADERPPSLAAVYPAGGATGVGLYPEIVVEFTDAMAATDTAGVISLVDDFGKAIAGTGRFDGQRFLFRPAERLDYATTYTAIVSDTVRDVAGNQLYRESRSAFTTVDDAREVVITGTVLAPGEGISVEGVEVRVSLSPDPRDPAARTVGYAQADADGRFVVRGLAANSEAEPTYYLVAAIDDNGDGAPELLGGFGFAGGKAGELPKFAGGERLENVEVVLSRADLRGPRVTEAAVAPNPTAGQEGCYVRAACLDDEGSAVAGAEVFFDDVWSDGTGIALRPAAGEWGTGAALAGEAFILSLRRADIGRRGEHIAYFHARDAAGNWGELAEVPFDVTPGPRSAAGVGGLVTFDKLPAEGVLVIATAAGAEADALPAAFAISDRDGRYRLTDLPAGAYVLAARFDEDKDGRWRPGEPVGAVPAVSLNPGMTARANLELTYGPSLSGANARLQVYAEGPGLQSRAVLALMAAAGDRDRNLVRVWARLPSGEEVALGDDGVPPDAAAGDGVFTFERTFSPGEWASIAEGPAAIFAEDAKANRAAAAVNAAPGLEVVRLEPPAEVKVETAADGIVVSWGSVPRAEGGYVVFIVPEDRLARFTEPGSAEVYSNFERPVFETTLAIPYNALTDWWAYPAGSRFIAMVVASAGDGDTFQSSDKALATAIWAKPARK